ncbi:hypothetical protein [Aquimarina algicola]|uniref:Uncharacterized protein n=1 Tax=Aquimarina algicola TaxID=2589995 RepID=A0A504J604_9FLAO|nr:hypothetical protein [Aquimarina algicola]TPN84015.1 hypothetical protein FHK87_18810 [Aquimarina algicola]
MRIFIFLGIVLCCVGCQSKKSETSENNVLIAKLDSLSKDKIKIDLLKLSSDAEKNLESFDDFQNLRSIMTSMRNGNPHFVNKHADSVELLISIFKENLSNDLDVNTINSRIAVLTTEIGLLKLLTEQKNPDPKEILEANTKLAKAYNSLIIQLNELSLAIPENIEKELLRDLELGDEEDPK